jgi:hypothetical protein
VAIRSSSERWGGGCAPERSDHVSSGIISLHTFLPVSTVLMPKYISTLMPPRAMERCKRVASREHVPRIGSVLPRWNMQRPRLRDVSVSALAWRGRASICGQVPAAPRRRSGRATGDGLLIPSRRCNRVAQCVMRHAYSLPTCSQWNTRCDLHPSPLPRYG